MDTVVTPYFRASYSNLFKPQLNNMSGEMEYSVVALFPKGENLTELKALARKACEKTWGTDIQKWPKKLRLPFRDQGEKEKEGRLPDGYVEGALFLTLKSKQKPGIIDQSRQDILDETEIYAGCWIRAVVNAYTYDTKGNQGVAFGLQHVQKVKDGDSLSGRTRAQDVFEPIVVEGEEGETPSSALSLFS